MAAYPREKCCCDQKQHDVQQQRRQQQQDPVAAGPSSSIRRCAFLCGLLPYGCYRFLSHRVSSFLSSSSSIRRKEKRHTHPTTKPNTQPKLNTQRNSTPATSKRPVSSFSSKEEGPISAPSSKNPGPSYIKLILTRQSNWATPTAGAPPASQNTPKTPQKTKKIKGAACNSNTELSEHSRRNRERPPHRMR
jgi:hypothetical protein